MYCKHCGKEIADDTKFCPECGGQITGPAPLLQVDPNMPKKRKSGCGTCGLIALGVLIAFIALIFFPIIFSGTNSETTQTESTQATTTPTTAPTEEPVIEITPSELYNAYEENEVAADNEYKGKKVRITGTIEDIGKDILDDVYITINAGDYDEIQCYFENQKQIDKVATLKSGEEVTIVGECSGLSILNVVLQNCELE
jgi:hypothetical protein